MATIIENRYVRQEQMAEEYASKVLAGRMRFGAVLGFVLILFVMVSSFAHGDKVTAAVFLICLLIPIVTLGMAPKLAYRDLLGKEQRIHGSRRDYQTVVRFGDRIEIEEDGYQLTADYADLVAVYELEHSWVLMVSRNNGIQLDVNGFVKGDAEQLRQLLNSRCGSIRFIKK